MSRYRSRQHWACNHTSFVIFWYSSLELVWTQQLVDWEGEFLPRRLWELDLHICLGNSWPNTSFLIPTTSMEIVHRDTEDSLWIYPQLRLKLTNPAFCAKVSGMNITCPSTDFHFVAFRIPGPAEVAEYSGRCIAGSAPDVAPHPTSGSFTASSWFVLGIIIRWMQRRFIYSNPANMKNGLDDNFKGRNFQIISCKVYLGGMGAGVNTKPPAAPTRMMNFIWRGLCPWRKLIEDSMVRIIPFV